MRGGVKDGAGGGCLLPVGGSGGMSATSTACHYVFFPNPKTAAGASGALLRSVATASGRRAFYASSSVERKVDWLAVGSCCRSPEPGTSPSPGSCPTIEPPTPAVPGVCLCVGVGVGGGAA